MYFCLDENNKYLYTIIQKFVVSKIFFKDINTFIQQGCIKLIKSDSKDIYNVTKDFYFLSSKY